MLFYPVSRFAEFWILFPSWSELHGCADTLNIWILTFIYQWSLNGSHDADIVYQWTPNGSWNRLLDTVDKLNF